MDFVLKWVISNLTWRDVFEFVLISIKIAVVKNTTPTTFYFNFLSSNVNSDGQYKIQTSHPVSQDRQPNFPTCTD